MHFSKNVFSWTIPARESISYLFRYESRSIIVLFYSYELLYFTPLLCYFMIFSTTHQLHPLTWFCWIIWTGTKVGFLENTMMTLFFLLVPIQNYRIFFFVKASCFEKDLVLPWLREINPRERAEEVMLSASNCSLFFLAKQSILVEFMSDSEANRG